MHWSGKRDSNPRPQPWQGCALPLSYFRITQQWNYIIWRKFVKRFFAFSSNFFWETGSTVYRPSSIYRPPYLPLKSMLEKACVSYSVLCLVFCRSAPVSGLIVKNLFPYLSSQTLNLYQADRQNPSNEKGANISRQKCKPLSSLSKLTSPSVSPIASPSSSIRASATKALRCGPTRGGGESGSRRRCRAL